MASIAFLGSSEGTHSPSVLAKAGAFEISTTFSLTVLAIVVPPPPSPQLILTPQTTLNIPDDSLVTVDITLNGLSGFNLPVHVHLTGAGSTIGISGPVQQPLPSGLSSPDCGPDQFATGIDVTPGNTISCSIAASTLSLVANAPGPGFLANVEVFGVFPISSPGSAISLPFQVCILLSPTATPGCGVNMQGGGSSPSKLSGSPARYNRLTSESSAPSADEPIFISDVAFAPLTPKAGDSVNISARLTNQSASKISGAIVKLLANGKEVAVKDVSITAGGFADINLEWIASNDFGVNIAISVGLNSDDESAQVILVPGLIVEGGNFSVGIPGRARIEVINNNCAGFRFFTESQTSCGGSSDIELTPSITADGQLLVDVFSMNGGILDLGPLPSSGLLSVPESSYTVRASMEASHVYAVENNGKYTLLYAAMVDSDIDPRLAALVNGSNSLADPSVGGLSDLFADSLGDLLDRVKITIELQWLYQDSGSRQFRYSFTPSRRAPKPSTFRQPRGRPVAQ